MRNKTNAALAANAHANLVLWAAVSQLLESNLTSTTSHTAAFRVLKIAKSEQHKYLKQFDGFIGKINDGKESK